jgi:hypothetical protein
MKVLVACEYSGIVREAFKKRGHDAWSCDLLPTDIPGQHIQGDVLREINGMNGHWDLMIAHPPCTYLCVTGNKWYKPEYKDRFPDRPQQREEAVSFFMALANANIDKIAVENPICIMSTRWRKPDQIIQPWQFGDKALKKTCLWLKNIPPLKHTKIVEPEYVIYKSRTKKSGVSKYPTAWAAKVKLTKMPLLWKAGPSPTRSKERSKTFQGIADAMAEQWG